MTVEDSSGGIYCVIRLGIFPILLLSALCIDAWTATIGAQRRHGQVGEAVEPGWARENITLAARQ